MENLVGLSLDSRAEGFKEGRDLSFSGLWKDDSSGSVERRAGIWSRGCCDNSGEWTGSRDL